MSPSANSGIGTLPLELITKVLESLPWKDVVRTRQVSLEFTVIIYTSFLSENTYFYYVIFTVGIAYL